MADEWICLDERLRPVLQDAAVERLCTGAAWSEGPVWIAQDQSVLWSDIPNNRILRWSAQDGMRVWASGVEYTNGHTLDRDGSLLHCSHGLRGIYRTPLVAGWLHGDTPMQCVVDRFAGKRLNSPNDLVVKRDGTLWFTDPPYGILSNHEGHQAESEIGCNHVFRFDPACGHLDSVSDWVDEPNGLAFSPDERLLYVSDTSAALRPAGQGNHHIVVFDVLDGARLDNPRVFAEIEPGLPDGFRIDAQGWLYTSSADSVQIYHPDGTLLGKLPVPEKVGNLCFGGPHGNQLFVVATTSLYRITLNTRGAAW
jgi:gluconolactonase